MKHLSSWLTVLILGAVPLSAAALDYGPNRALLAADGGSTQLSARPSAASMGTATKADGASASNVDGDAPEALPAAPPIIAPLASPGVSRPGQVPSASNKPIPKIVKPAAAPSPASWQSLLPGSIQ